MSKTNPELRCKIPGCITREFCRGWCKQHRRVIRRLEQKFWENVQQSDPDVCWPWLAASKQYPYGTIRYRWPGTLRTIKSAAPHVALMLSLGRQLRPGYEACYRCTLKRCCNPSHLFEGTHQQNMSGYKP